MILESKEKKHHWEVHMIQMSDHPVSVHYRNICKPSWESRGLDVKLFEAITPKDLSILKDLHFTRIYSIGSGLEGRDFTDTELAIWGSHYALWKQCAEQNNPYIIIEHDALLMKPLPFEKMKHWNVVLCLGYTYLKGNGPVGSKWPCGAYTLHPAKAKILVNHVRGCIIKANSDAYIQKFTTVDDKYFSAVQLYHADMGNTIRHGNKEPDITFYQPTR